MYILHVFTCIAAMGSKLMYNLIELKVHVHAHVYTYYRFYLTIKWITIQMINIEKVNILYLHVHVYINL